MLEWMDFTEYVICIYTICQTKCMIAKSSWKCGKVQVHFNVTSNSHMDVSYGRDDDNDEYDERESELHTESEWCCTVCHAITQKHTCYIKPIPYCAIAVATETHSSSVRSLLVSFKKFCTAFLWAKTATTTDCHCCYDDDKELFNSFIFCLVSFLPFYHSTTL